MTAIHEAGHALLHYYLKDADPLHKVTIIPHGRALGVTMPLPKEDVYSHTRGWIRDFIVVCYGGWTAERIFYSETTTGTKQDLEQATGLARRMVCEWGMADEMGPVTYGQEDEPIFIGKEIARHKDYSEDTARQIDTAVKKILDEAKDYADELLHTHKGELEKLADALLVKETLVDDEVRSLLGFPPRENPAALAGGT
jgi:cell division protease FtsH